MFKVKTAAETQDAGSADFKANFNADFNDGSTGRFFSIKWKLSLAFIALTIGIVAIYILIAKRTFESDKVSYIFDTQQRQVNQWVHDIKDQISRTVFDARAILSGYDFANQKLAGMSQRLLSHHDFLLGIQVNDAVTGKSLARIENKEGALTRLPEEVSRRHPASEMDLTYVADDIFTLELPDVSANGEKIVLRILFKVKDFFSDAFDGQEILLASGSRILLSSKMGVLKPPQIMEFLMERAGNQSDLTQIKVIDGARYLISGASLGLAKMNVFSFVSEEIALKATRTLYQRSLMFLVFSFFATVLISMALSLRLTQNLFDLSRVAEKFGQGDFSAKPNFRSSDEVGLLAIAFRKMITEIQGLLTERVDKVRMEQELKTARAVQDNLFPRETSFATGQLKLTGRYETTTECGGDWWYYFQRDRWLYIVCADATGHGTPAALITAAIRSAFAQVELNEMSLGEIANCCDEAVFQCSRSALFMTAVVIRLNVNTGEGSFINSSHEPPMIFEYDLTEQKISIEDIVTDPGPRLGERNRDWTEHPIAIRSGQRLFVYTDGLSSPLNTEGREFSGRKLKKALIAAAAHVDQNAFMDAILSSMREYSGGADFPDDVTFITIDHNYHVG